MGFIWGLDRGYIGCTWGLYRGYIGLYRKRNSILG